MSELSSYSTERDLPRRRHRRDLGAQTLVAVVLALFVSVGTTWATPGQERQAARDACALTTGTWDNAAGTCTPAPLEGAEVNNNPPACQAPAFLGENDRVCKIVVCNPSGNGATQTVNWSATEQFDLPNAAGICAVAAPVDPVVKVCRDGATVETKTSLKLPTDVDGACVVIPPSDPVVKVCRDGATVETKTSLKLPTDVDGACVVIPPSDPVIKVCRAGVTTDTKTSLKLTTDISSECPAGQSTNTGGTGTGSGGGTGTGGAVAGGDTGGPAEEEVAPDDEEAPVGPAAETGGEGTVDAADAETEDVAAADAAAGDGDSLPFTGSTMTSVWVAGILALMLGAFAHAEGARAARRRRVAAR